MRRGDGTYTSWRKMRERTGNPNEIGYRHYGGRGITCCSRWSLFKNFLEDMGPRPEGMSIDRVDIDGPYSPDNCRWATRSQQMKGRGNWKISDTQIERVKDLLLTSNESNRAIAKYLGISNGTINNIMNGRENYV